MNHDYLNSRTQENLIVAVDLIAASYESACNS